MGGFGELQNLDGNLMVPKSDDKITVIARWRNHRDVPKTYHLEDRFCGKAWTENLTSPFVAQNINHYDLSDQALPYRDVLVIPVLGRDNEVLATINVDSKVPYHFPTSEGELLKLGTAVAPYVRLMALVLDYRPLERGSRRQSAGEEGGAN
jgi:hypothetical protein